MSNNTNSSNTRNYYLCKIIPAFLSFSSYLTKAQVDSTSAIFAVSFHIPVHNTSVYFTKLYSIRCLMMGVGSFAEYIAYVCVNSFNNSENNRKYISLVNLCLLLITRLIFLVLTYYSSQLGYHVYVVLCFEAFFCGCLMSITAIVPQHSVVITLGYNICRLLIPFLQFLLDLFCNKRPLNMIKIMCWFIFLLTIVGIILWIYYIYGGCSSVDTDKNDQKNKENEVNGNGHKNTDMATFSETMHKALSPCLMFPAGSIFKDFLYPGVLPYAVLQRDKCHIINILATVFYGLGSIVLFILENAQAFNEWSGFYDAFWILSIPITVITMYTFMAIHTRVPSAVRIRNSRPIVMAMTLSVLIYYSFLYSLSFAGVPKVVHTAFKDNKKGNNGVITFNLISSLIYRFVFSKISVGYNDTRVNLEYHLPKFRPNHRMSKSNTLWYIFRNTFRRAGRDTIEDFRMNVKNYL